MALDEVYSIEIRDKVISDSSLYRIIETIKTNTLIELSLGGNELGDRGAIALAEAIKTNTSLTDFYLCCISQYEIVFKATVWFPATV
jgi:hypothetical protein